MCEICSRLIINTPEGHHWRRSGYFIVNFKEILHIVLQFPFLNLNKQIPVDLHLFLYDESGSTPSNKTQVLTKNIKFGKYHVRPLGLTPYMLFLICWNWIFESIVVSGKTPFFVIGPFYTPHSVCLNIGFCQGGSVWKCCVFNRNTFN